MPNQWKMAKIILLKKPDQPSYIFFSTYKPILLLSTLKKAIELVIATCIGYLANKHLFLPSNYFGDLKGKSIVDALLTLQEKIYQA